MCMALFILAGVSVVSVAMLLIERQDIDLLQQQVTSLRQENTDLRSRLEDHQNDLVTQQ